MRAEKAAAKDTAEAFLHAESSIEYITQCRDIYLRCYSAESEGLMKNQLSGGHDTCCAAEAAVPMAVGDCCSAKESEVAALAGQPEVRKMLMVVLGINFTMFVAEFGAGIAGRSTALIADSVDMLGDALVYTLSLYVLNRGLRWRAGAALAKGVTIAAFGIGVAVEVAYKLLYGVTPVVSTMLLFGSLALVANLTCLALLYRHRTRDVNMSSTFECSRNDVIANVAVLLAAGGVYVFNAGWPDILVGAIVAGLFLRSAFRIVREAWPQFRSLHPTATASLD